MDANGKERYDNILQNLEHDENTIQNYILKEITINKHVMDNDDIQILNKSNKKLIDIVSQTDKNRYKIHLEELYSITNYITIRIMDIGNSLKMYRLGIPHSSIIKQTDLDKQNYISNDLKYN